MKKKILSLLSLRLGTNYLLLYTIYFTLFFKHNFFSSYKIQNKTIQFTSFLLLKILTDMQTEKHPKDVWLFFCLFQDYIQNFRICLYFLHCGIFTSGQGVFTTCSKYDRQQETCQKLRTFLLPSDRVRREEEY